MGCMIFLSPFIDIKMVYISRVSFLDSMFSFDLCLDLKLPDIFGLFLSAFLDFLFFVTHKYRSGCSGLYGMYRVWIWKKRGCQRSILLSFFCWNWKIAFPRNKYLLMAANRNYSVEQKISSKRIMKCQISFFWVFILVLNKFAILLHCLNFGFEELFLSFS